MRLWLLIGLAVQLGAEIDLRELADRTLLDGPWTVTAGRSTLQIPVNNYYSEAPYWWPDPKVVRVSFLRSTTRKNPH